MDEIIRKWDSTATFIMVVVGAIIGLNGIWKFSFLVYENEGGTFFIPYILAIVIMAVPFLVLEFGLGFRFKSSLPKIFYNIKKEFEILGWFIVFLIFLVLIYYTCILGWDLVYIVLSLFKGWGSNPSVFFTNTLLHSTSNPYGLTYLVVPVGIALLFIWGLIYFISKREINKGIANATKICLVLAFILTVGLIIYALQLPGSHTGIKILFNPNLEYLFDGNLWLTAFGQLIFSYGLGYGIAATYSSYLNEKPKLIDTAWIIVLISLIIEILFSILIFAILGFIALGNNITITSLVSDGYSLIFVVLPTAFNIMGPWVYIVAPAFFLILVVVGITVSIALIEPLAYSICEKLGWSKDRAVKNLVFVGLFASFIFATGMGEYLLRLTESFISQFAIVLALLFEILVIGWVCNLDGVISLLNENSFIKIDKFWLVTIKFIIPIILLIIWIADVYNLIITGNRTTLLVESIIASIFVLVPLAFTIIPAPEDYSVEFDNDGGQGFNYFKGQTTLDDVKSIESDDDKSISKGFMDKFLSRASKSESEDSMSCESELAKSRYGEDESENSGSESSKSDISDDYEDSKEHGRFRLSRNKVDKATDNEESKHLFDSHGSFLDPFKFGRSKNKDKTILKNVDLSSEEFDSVQEQEAKLKAKKSKSKINEKSGGDDDLDALISSLSDDFEEDNNFDDDFNVIEVERPREISDEELARITDVDIIDREEDKKQHKFKNSKDFDFDDLESDNSSSSNNGSGSTSKKVKNIKSEVENSTSGKSNLKPKSKSEGSSAGKPKPKSETKEEEYEEFTDDFFDDGVFGDEGYEYLLDDYVEPKSSKSSPGKPKSKTARQNKSKSLQRKENLKADKNNVKYYDFEGKGADSVFNLDE